uniref:NADH-ubiquinone oxidoreductase chain 4 n=1 Tax=Dunaliella salina TaxID=3046 RepID=D0FXU2_DUNSA|nr:NADH dehydrogenase subunit 4 [Dunaliella salina]ACS95022.1 NADH dehydrogenase subunit 4 [Dunaliella salina]AOO35675.1 NADH dehydrogenase subunit 4 [Dunaliella salina]
MILDLLLQPNTTIVTLLLTFAFLCFVLLFIPIYNYSMFRILSLAVAFVPLGWSLYLWILYNGSGPTFQCICHIPMIHLTFGIDAAGLSLVILTSAIFPLCIMLMRTISGILTFLLLELVILGSLLVLDLLGFYLLFEASLILLYLLIARPERLTGTQYVKHSVGDYSTMDAAYKITLYTMVGSLLFLPVIFILYANYGSTNLLILTCSDNPMLSVDKQLILGWGLLAVFAVKIPLIPLAVWLPHAHVAAPTAGSVLLAGVLLKLGGIGIIRYLIPIFPVFVVKIFPFIAVMCLISFLFSTLTTLRQIDLKKIVAYSSIAHMSLVTLAIFSLSEHSVASSTFMMVAHGLVSPALFLLVGFLYERSHTKYLPYLTGLGSHMPIYASLFFILTLANLSFPLFPNFIAEVLCLVSLFAVHSLYAYIFCISQVLGAVYGFWTFNRVMHGYNSNTFTVKTSVVDLSRREVSLILPLLIGIFWLGLKPMA